MTHAIHKKLLVGITTGQTSADRHKNEQDEMPKDDPPKNASGTADW